MLESKSHVAAFAANLSRGLCGFATPHVQLAQGLVFWLTQLLLKQLLEELHRLFILLEGYGLFPPV